MPHWVLVIALDYSSDFRIKGNLALAGFALSVPQARDTRESRAGVPTSIVGWYTGIRAAQGASSPASEAARGDEGFIHDVDVVGLRLRGPLA